MPISPRDVAYAFETNDDPGPWRVQLRLRSVFALAEHITDFAISILAAERRTLDTRPTSILATPGGCDLTRDLQAEIGRAPDRLLAFLTHPDRVELTNDGSKRLLRPATAGEADIRTVVDTACLTGNGPFGNILKIVGP